MKDEIPFWVPFDGVNLPKNAVVGGKYKGQKVFIGRAHHERSLTPGMVLENEKVIMLPWGCVSNTKNDFEILCCEGSANWVVADSGNCPQNAFRAGYSEVYSEPLYVGRYKHGDSIVCGKIQPSHHVCYIAYEGNELNNKHYEVLVI
ncbi:uncharacterized protein [Chironomus tepperi]|uniref:uncharacterized protein n=1 Tax=Chironomus tepperi TaxID=113505 RepID=UPI00391F482C